MPIKFAVHFTKLFKDGEKIDEFRVFGKDLNITQSQLFSRSYVDKLISNLMAEYDAEITINKITIL